MNRKNTHHLVTPVGTFAKRSLAAAIFAAQNLGYKSVVQLSDGTTVATYHPNLGVTINVR